jgi:hypothetical protein
MRQITDHIVNPCNEKLTITVTDEPGAGGANHRYLIEGFDTESNVARINDDGSLNAPATRCVILFQNGPIPERGTNGITHEALLAIVVDRLRSFQLGAYRCRENAYALENIEVAMHWLQQRTLTRMRRGVEGTHQV